jgi:flagellar protein FliO/FliZ
VLKQVKASKEERQSGLGLDTVATLPLGPNRSLHLIRAGHELVLVGAGEHGVTPIRTYSEAEARELGLLEDAVEPASVERAPIRVPGAGRALDALRARTVIR